MSAPSRMTRNRIIGLAVLAVLVVAMILNTKFLTPTELAAALPKPFDPKGTAAELFERAKSELPGKAQDLSEVVPAVQADLKAAAEEYDAVSPAEGSYVFPVKTTATVIDATADSLRLQVDGVGSTPIIVPLTTAVNGTVLRDAMGFKFADAPGQTDYQYVGDELKKLMQAQVEQSLSDPGSAKGKQVKVVGVISILSPTGAPPPKAKPINIQPLSVEEA